MENKTVVMSIAKYLEIKAAGKALSNDPTRVVMKGYYYDAAKERITATSGHIMRFVYVSKDDWGQDSFIFDRLSFEFSLKNIKDLHFAGAKVTDDQTFSVDLTQIEGEYPNIDQVLPSKREGIKEIMLNPDVLKDFLSSFPKMYSNWLRYEFSGPLGAITVYRDKTVVGLIMPGRAPRTWAERPEIEAVAV